MATDEGEFNGLESQGAPNCVFKGPQWQNGGSSYSREMNGTSRGNFFQGASETVNRLMLSSSFLDEFLAQLVVCCFPCYHSRFSPSVALEGLEQGGNVVGGWSRELSVGLIME